MFYWNKRQVCSLIHSTLIEHLLHAPDKQCMFSQESIKCQCNGFSSVVDVFTKSRKQGVQAGKDFLEEMTSKGRLEENISIYLKYTLSSPQSIPLLLDLHLPSSAPCQVFFFSWKNCMPLWSLVNIKVVEQSYLSSHWGEVGNKDGRYIHIGNKVYFAWLVCYEKWHKIKLVSVEHLNAQERLTSSNYTMCSEFLYTLEQVIRNTDLIPTF